jgi:hypothetical protein
LFRHCRVGQAEALRVFCLEATHVTDADRLRKLPALVALAFCWTHTTFCPERRSAEPL